MCSYRIFLNYPLVCIPSIHAFMHIECINKKAMHGDRSYCVLILNEVGTGWLCSVYGFYHLLITNNVIIPIIFVL